MYRVGKTSGPNERRIFHCYFDMFQPLHPHDSIVMAHVLEHLDDSAATLKATRTWLALGGSIHIVAPNARSRHRGVGVLMERIPITATMDKRDLLLRHRQVCHRESLRCHIAAGGLQIRYEESIFLKILTNAQPERMNAQLIEALFKLGPQLLDLCANVYCEVAPDFALSASDSL